MAKMGRKKKLYLLISMNATQSGNYFLGAFREQRSGHAARDDFRVGVSCVTRVVKSQDYLKQMSGDTLQQNGLAIYDAVR
jgi:hypothetical protein